MKTIWKFEVEVPIYEKLELYIAQKAKIIYVGEQNNKICMWVEIEEKDVDKTYYGDTGINENPRVFYVHGTGDFFSPELKYIGTALLDNGRFVWHVYEDKGE